MCGIAGIVSNHLDSTHMASALEAMQDSLKHRGPDGQGSFYSPSGHAALTHTRLSIIELSELGAQPMSTQDGSLTVTFNGEIYNHNELRTELQDIGYSFKGHSDTEVLINLYQQFGPCCVKKLRGMFAFVIWDEKENLAFAARDPLGIKPLYYCESHAEQGSSLSFASEVRSVIQSGLSSKELDPQGLDSYFLRGSVAEPRTLLRDIRLLEAGHTLTWKHGEASIEPYWRLHFKETDITTNEAVTRTRAALESSIKAHFVSDVPVGIFLSGGIDSTAIVALAKHLGFENINTYSIAFEDPGWNEGDLAQRVADHFDTNHTEFLMTPELAKPLFDEYLGKMDQVTIDGFNTFCVSKLACERGEKVVLSGLGGDELFAGYKSFTLVPKMAKLSRAFAWFRQLIRIKARVLNKLLGARLRRVFDFFLRPGSTAAAQQSLRGVFSISEAKELTQLYLGTNNESDFIQTPEPTQPTIADKVSELELTTYMRNQLLRDSDVTSMAWGLELRVPFVDSVLIDEVSQIPAQIRLQQGKKLLTDSVPEIPEWVVNRPKQGFRFPFDEWFSEQWKDLTISSTPPPWIKLQPWYRRWSLLVLEDWISRHVR